MSVEGRGGEVRGRTVLRVDLVRHRDGGEGIGDQSLGTRELGNEVPSPIPTTRLHQLVSTMKEGRTHLEDDDMDVLFRHSDGPVRLLLPLLARELAHIESWDPPSLSRTPRSIKQRQQTRRVVHHRNLHSSSAMHSSRKQE
jgi:hypothetical protein